jgi:hypothetical protein
LINSFFFSFSVQAQKTTVADYNIAWTTPGMNSQGSMPLGNGDIGINAWVETSGDLVFYLSKTDAWCENGQLLKLGQIRVSLSPNPFNGNTTWDKHFRFPAFWGPNYDWSPDQDHGNVAMIALQRMLIQYDNDSITMLPAWPAG